MVWTWIIFLCFSLSTFAQQGASAPEVSPGAAGQSEAPLSAAPGRTDRRITLDVVVTEKSGKPVAGLGEQNFTIVDNKQAQKILSFQAVGGTRAAGISDPGSPGPEILLLIDEVNLSFQGVAVTRTQVEKFLRQNEGHLAYPVSMIFFSDSGVRLQNGASRDGNALAALLDSTDSQLRTMKRTQGFWGASDRRRLSLQTLEQIIAYEMNRPGKKLLVWISPGWAMLSGPEEAAGMDPKAQQGLFNSIARISTELRQARITLYSVDPLGTGDTGDLRPFYYQDFVKGVSKPRQVQMGDLALQVLASQSGGLVLNSSNDVSGEIEDCVRDANASYILSFDSLPAEAANEYHALQIQVGAPGLKARTRAGYYAQP